MKKIVVQLYCKKSFFQLFGQHMFVEALWEEERKKMKKFIASQGEEITDLKEQLASQKQQMDHALKLVDQALACRPPSWAYAHYLKEQFFLFQLMLTLKDINAEFKLAQEFYGLYQTMPSW